MLRGRRLSFAGAALGAGIVQSNRHQGKIWIWQKFLAVPVVQIGRNRRIIGGNAATIAGRIGAFGAGAVLMAYFEQLGLVLEFADPLTGLRRCPNSPH